MAYTITVEQIHAFEKHLRLEERSASTARKYADAVTAFYDFLPLDKILSLPLAFPDTIGYNYKNREGANRNGKQYAAICAAAGTALPRAGELAVGKIRGNYRDCWRWNAFH